MNVGELQVGFGILDWQTTLDKPWVLTKSKLQRSSAAIRGKRKEKKLEMKNRKKKTSDEKREEEDMSEEESEDNDEFEVDIH